MCFAAKLCIFVLMIAKYIMQTLLYKTQPAKLDIEFPVS